MKTINTGATPWWLIVVVLLLAIPVLSLILAMIVTSIHFIDEGNVGVYFKYGALEVPKYLAPKKRT